MDVFAVLFLENPEQSEEGECDAEEDDEEDDEEEVEEEDDEEDEEDGEPSEKERSFASARVMSPFANPL